MSGMLELLIGLATGGGGTIAAQAAVGWFKSRAELARVDRGVDMTIEQHRDKLTLDLLTAARSEMSALHGEISQLRPISARVAHLEEALDHIHALLNAEGEAERRAAERRARAYLRRMRPEGPRVGRDIEQGE